MAPIGKSNDGLAGLEGSGGRELVQASPNRDAVA